MNIIDLDFKIVNEFNEAEYEEWAIENLTEYTSMITAIKEKIILDIREEQLTELIETDAQHFINAMNNVFNVGDSLVYEISLDVKFLEDEDNNFVLDANEIPIPIGASARCEILYMSISTFDNNSSCLETENHLSPAQKLVFVAY